MLLCRGVEQVIEPTLPQRTAFRRICGQAISCSSRLDVPKKGWLAGVRIRIGCG
jgi:hypothetical protein